MDYVVVVEQSEGEVRDMIKEAITLHLESLRSHGEPVPKPTARAFTVHAA